MKLRTKTLLAIGVTLVVLVIAISTASYLIVTQSILTAEEQGSKQSMESVLGIFDRTSVEFDERFLDWSAWDDSYEFVVDKNKAYIDANLIFETYQTIKIQAVAFVDAKGQVVYSGSADPEITKEIPLLPEVQARLKVDDPLIKTALEGKHTTGFLPTSAGPMLLTVQPIMPSTGQGKARGVVVFGRYMSDEILGKMSDTARLPIHLAEYKTLKDDTKQIANKIEKEKGTVIKEKNDQVLNGYALLNDIDGKPYLLVSVDMKRDIYQTGKKSQFNLILFLILAGIVLGGITLLQLEFMILKRLSRLSDDVEEIGQTYDLSKRVYDEGKDELADFGKAMNRMLAKLHELEKVLAVERDKSEKLLLNILPSDIADRLKESNEKIADHYEEASVLFADIVNFTAMSATLQPSELVAILNGIFSMFDEVVDTLKLEKIKTIGDAYMVVSGLPDPRPDHAIVMARLALAMRRALDRFNRERDLSIEIRIGINSGPVVAGVVGTKKFLYDLWGDTVNTASRMESTGVPGQIQVTEETRKRIQTKFRTVYRGKVAVKGKGELDTYMLQDEIMD